MSEELSRIEARADSLVDSHTELLEQLVAMRKKHKLTQALVAERMSVSQPTVAAFEHYDANPTLSTLRRYALAVGARLENSVVDDCSDPVATFEKIKESFHVLPPKRPVRVWSKPTVRVLADV